MNDELENKIHILISQELGLSLVVRAAARFSNPGGLAVMRWA